ncbi:MAG: acyl-CoA dehydrogenase [Gammaproteobacteria bacterium TMED78]|nr:MAG: acyl-CoA dehydrogenase [Gammaproteobacteria bacterium TMED78]|tara:strand:+ start:18616 stop:19773 length:1158 start_codon:yes stop_codon:yes gene_type:complete
MKNNSDLLNIELYLNDDEILIRDKVREFVNNNVLPIINHCFSNHEFPKEIINKLGALGLFGSNLKGYGCAGLNNISYGLICQELEKGDSSIRSFFSVQSSLSMYAIHTFGSEEQKNSYLPKMSKGEIVGSFGLSESHGGSDPANMKTIAKKDGNDWILNGSKKWITNGVIADIAIVWAMTDDGIKGFIVEKDMSGFSTNEIQDKFSLRASTTAELFFKNVRIPKNNILPQAMGLGAPLKCLSQARYGIIWGAIGAAQACFKEVLEYSKNRELFGRSLDANQTIQIRLAEMARRISIGQLLAFHIGKLKDANTIDPAQISIGKWNNARVALEVARDCRDILGGSGISIKYCAIRHMLNLESIITYEGTETVHQLIVGKELTGISAF